MELVFVQLLVSVLLRLLWEILKSDNKLNNSETRTDFVSIHNQTCLLQWFGLVLWNIEMTNRNLIATEEECSIIKLVICCTFQSRVKWGRREMNNLDMYILGFNPRTADWFKSHFCVVGSNLLISKRSTVLWSTYFLWSGLFILKKSAAFSSSDLAWPGCLLGWLLNYEAYNVLIVDCASE